MGRDFKRKTNQRTKHAHFPDLKLGGRLNSAVRPGARRSPKKPQQQVRLITSEKLVNLLFDVAAWFLFTSNVLLTLQYADVLLPFILTGT